jgi:hypothetical protein
MSEKVPGRSKLCPAHHAQMSRTIDSEVETHELRTIRHGDPRAWGRRLGGAPGSAVSGGLSPKAGV